MDQKKWSQAEAQVPMVAQVLANVAAGLDRVSLTLERQLPRRASTVQ
jgi:hypothetical protein